MTTVVLSVLVFMLAGLGLGLGVLFGRRSIKGSCGGCVDCLGKERRS